MKRAPPPSAAAVDELIDLIVRFLRHGVLPNTIDALVDAAKAKYRAEGTADTIAEIKRQFKQELEEE